MSDKRGIVLGVYSGEGSDYKKKGKKKVGLTPYARKYNEYTSGELLKKVKISGPIACGDYRIFWGLGKKHTAIAVVGLGDSSSWSPLEGINGKKENVRIAAGAGAYALFKRKILEIEFDDLCDAENAAIGAILQTYTFQDNKSDKEVKIRPNIFLVDEANDRQNKDWQRGVIIAKSQNFAKKLMETPANLMTPTKFAECVTEKLSKFHVKCVAHDREWAEELCMHSFLSVSNGSDEPPIFLELTYKGTNRNQPFCCLVGKGITFDSGGISIKPAKQMDIMKADMGGAACVCATILGLAQLKVPVNVKGLLPLTENLINGRATKPGDVVRAMNGKSICVDNTDFEGRLVLADALCYCEKFNPEYILDIATLTFDAIVALGDCVAGSFTNNEDIWNKINAAGYETGDRVWRMPLYKYYTSLMTNFNGYDINNIGKGQGAGSCTAAAFLHEFVPKNTPWIHIDMAGHIFSGGDQSYTRHSTMPGRPTRTLIEFVSNNSEGCKMRKSEKQ